MDITFVLIGLQVCFHRAIKHENDVIIKWLALSPSYEKSKFQVSYIRDSYKRSPRFSPGYECTENMFYFLNKVYLAAVHKIWNKRDWGFFTLSPYLFILAISIRIDWSTMSNAFFRFMKSTPFIWPLSILRRQSSVGFNKVGYSIMAIRTIGNSILSKGQCHMTYTRHTWNVTDRKQGIIGTWYKEFWR